MGIGSKAKDVGAVGLVLTGLAVLMFLGIALLYGAAEISVWALEWTPGAFALVFWASVLLLIPLAIIGPTRNFAGHGFVVASYAFGLVLWIWAMAFTYAEWGLTAVIIGLMVFGVGVVVVALLAALLNGFWGLLGTLVFLIFLTYGSRGLGYWLSEKANERSLERARAAARTDLIDGVAKARNPSEGG